MARYLSKQCLLPWSMLVLFMIDHYVISGDDLCPAMCSCNHHHSVQGTIVNCSNRDLTSIPDVLPVDTIELYLDQNTILNLSPDDFSVMPKLTRLVLHNCKLKSIDSEVFSDDKFLVLEELDLSNNQLPSIPYRIPSSLRLLKVSDNQIIDLNTSQFSNYTNLTQLILSRNSIQSLHLHSFHAAPANDNEKDSTTSRISFPALERLWLDENQISAIDPDAFTDLPALNALTLAGNSLSHLKSKTFHGLAHLQHLNLSHSSLITIPDNVFKSLDDLRYLTLAHNNLTEMPVGLPLLEWFDLSHNQIRTVSENRKPDVYPAEVLNLAHNPLHCDCSLLWLKELWDRREYVLKYTALQAESFIPTCATPSAMEGKSWDMLGVEAFTCPKKGETEEEFFIGGMRNFGFDPTQMQVKTGIVTDTSMELYWTLKGYIPFTSVFVQYYVFGMRSKTAKHLELPTSQKEYTFKHLRPNTNYVVCIVPKMRTSYSAETAASLLNPVSLEHCLEVATKEAQPVEMISYVTIFWYYLLGMLATIILLFSCIGGIGLLYSVWQSRCTDWSAKYVQIDEPLPQTSSPKPDTTPKTENSSKNPTVDPQLADLISNFLSKDGDKEHTD